MLKLNLKVIRIIFVILYLIISSNVARAEDINKLITKICLQGFMTEMNLAGQTPKIHIGKFACNCFLDRVSNGSDIETAQKLCREEASNKFNI